MAMQLEYTLVLSFLPRFTSHSPSAPYPKADLQLFGPLLHFLCLIHNFSFFSLSPHPSSFFSFIVPHLISVFPNFFTYSFFLFNLSLKAQFPYVITVFCVFMFCEFQCLKKFTDFHEPYCKCYASRGSINL
jgi:hypothetical protein